MKVLIVDDHLIIRSHLQKVLIKEGYDAMVAADGQEALTKAQEKQPDLILMDVQMPVMNGFEAIEKLKTSKDTAAIPVVMLTGMDDLEDEKLGIQLGADAYIKKPVIVADVLRLIETYRAR